MLDEDIQGTIASMAELAKNYGVKVILASILPTSAYHTAPGVEPQADRRPLARIRTINTWIKRLRGEKRAHCISITSPRWPTRAACSARS